MTSPKSQNSKGYSDSEKQSVNSLQKKDHKLKDASANKVMEGEDAKVEDIKDTGSMANEILAVDASVEKTSKKKTKKKAKKEEEDTNKITSSHANDVVEVKISKPEAEVEAEEAQPKEEVANKKLKKKKKTAEKIEIPKLEIPDPQTTVVQQVETSAKTKKNVTKSNVDTISASEPIKGYKQEKETILRDEDTKAKISSTKKAAEGNIPKLMDTELKKGKANNEDTVIKLKEDILNKKSGFHKTHNSMVSGAKEDYKAKVEKAEVVVPQPGKGNMKFGGESERLGPKLNSTLKSKKTAESPEKSQVILANEAMELNKQASERPSSSKYQSVNSPDKIKSDIGAKNTEKNLDVSNTGKSKTLKKEAQKLNENVKVSAIIKTKNQVESSTDNLIIDSSPRATSKERKSFDNSKHPIKRVSIHDTVTIKRSTSPQKARRELQNPRVKSFDAGKTEKVDPNDSFETRSKIWEIRKKEKLLEEEKKHFRKQIEECTFNPSVNKSPSVKLNMTGDFLQRSAEWSEKVKASIQSKSEQIREETMKPEIKKSRIKSGVSSAYQDLRSVRLHEVQRAPNSGGARADNFELIDHEPIGVQERLNEKLTEIRDIYDNISSSLKAKSTKNINTNRTNEIQKVIRSGGDDNNKKGQHFTYQTKNVISKTIPSVVNEEVSRLESLKHVLNPQKKKDTIANKTKKPMSEVYLTETDNAQEMLKTTTKHLEIRNNRYVMIDTNLSAIEKKEFESNDISLNLEAV